LPDKWLIASIFWRGKSGLYKDTVPVNGWRGQPQRECHRK